MEDSRRKVPKENKITQRSGCEGGYIYVVVMQVDEGRKESEGRAVEICTCGIGDLALVAGKQGGWCLNGFLKIDLS